MHSGRARSSTDVDSSFFARARFTFVASESSLRPSRNPPRQIGPYENGWRYFNRGPSSKLHLDQGQPRPCCGIHHVGGDRGHASMIGRTAAEKTRAAVRLLLNDAAVRRDGSCSERIGRTKHRYDGQTYGGGDVHRAGIVADEEVALRK